MSKESLKKALQALPAFERDEIERQRLFEIDTLAERHGCTTDQVREELKALRPRAKADRFEWLEAVTVRHDLGVRALRVAIALFSFSGATGYLWPSQASIAKRSGYDDEAVVRRGIEALRRIGAVRKVRVRDLPEEVASVALGAVANGGSGRSNRGNAYALVPPSAWPQIADTGTSCASHNRYTEYLYNHQSEPPLASPDISHSNAGYSPQTLEQVETLNNGSDGEKHSLKEVSL
ncbi:hypothetical protein PDO_2978 [Rhizobium sp. PDO1-076]|uniref:helix-turn-helix domain-containing protein n=1 Tax=Rhizobium sp. PDO1-076 TaxID=1125979 RepID=UPI00024E2D95|nr:helix-turn-helix domain-containing protein [Rhizobium sp. PDO1-076]EHS49771.1 hypothetical protein PDO_2978 [Rhizobium sp. PDO1-076]